MALQNPRIGDMVLPTHMPGMLPAAVSGMILGAVEIQSATGAATTLAASMTASMKRMIKAGKGGHLHPDVVRVGFSRDSMKVEKSVLAVEVQRTL